MDTSLKRIIAFVIDVVIISLVVSLINLLPIDPYQEKYKDTYEKYNEVVKKSSEDGSHDYKDEIIELNYEVYKYRTYSSIISATALILYFGVVPVVMNGQTIVSFTGRSAGGVHMNSIRPNMTMMEER